MHVIKRASMQPRPGAAREVIEAEFFLEPLMALLADPSRLDRACQRASGRVGWEVRQVVCVLA